MDRLFSAKLIQARVPAQAPPHKLVESAKIANEQSSKMTRSLLTHRASVTAL